MGDEPHLEAGEPCGLPGRYHCDGSTLARRPPGEVRGERVDQIDDDRRATSARQVRRRAHELRVHDVEATAREPLHGARRAPAGVEQHLEGTPVAQQPARERRCRPQHAERDDDEAHPERLDLRPQAGGRRTREERTAGDLVRRREQSQVMVGTHLVAPPWRHRQARHEEEHLHAASHRLVVTAWRQMPAVAPRR